MRKPAVILDIDQTVFKTPLFRKALKTYPLNESEFIELLYVLEKQVFQELVTKRNMIVAIFSSKKEFLKNANVLPQSPDVKKLKAYLKEYHNYQIYLVSDNLIRLTEAKEFNQNILTIWLSHEGANKTLSKKTRPDKTITTLQEIIPILDKKN